MGGKERKKLVLPCVGYTPELLLVGEWVSSFELNDNGARELPD